MFSIIRSFVFLSVVVYVVLLNSYSITGQDCEKYSAPVWDLISTQGIEFKPEEIERNDVPLELRGLPFFTFKLLGTSAESEFCLWAKRAGMRPNLESMGKLSVNEVGQLVHDYRGMKGNVSFALADFMKGEPIEYCVVSVDAKIKAFTKIVPYPIISTNEAGNRVSVELLDKRNFVITSERIRRHRVD